MANEDLIEAIETLTEAVNNLSGHIKELNDISLISIGSKTDYLSERLEETSKAVEKLTTEVNRNTFK